MQHPRASGTSMTSRVAHSPTEGETVMFTIIIVIVVAVAALLVYAATRPDSFRVQRSATIKALPDRIFPMIDSLKAWGPWSPCEKMDPDLKRTFRGPEVGQGSVYDSQ